RGGGRADALLEWCPAPAPGAGAAPGVLFPEPAPASPARLGFETIPIADRTLRVLEDSRRGAPATMVRAGDDRDLADIVAMDAARAGPFRFHLTRDRDAAAYAITRKRLLSGLGPAGARERPLFVAREGASAVAYVVIDAKNGVWAIDRCGERDGGRARIGG